MRLPDREDSLHAAAWLVRHHELQAHLAPPFVAGTATSRGARSLAVALDTWSEAGPALRARAQLSAARAAVLANEWREALTHASAARTWLARDPHATPDQWLDTYVLESRAWGRGSRADSSAAAADRAWSAAQASGVSAFARAEAQAWRGDALRKVARVREAEAALAEALVVLGREWPELDSERIRVEMNHAVALVSAGDQFGGAQRYRLLLGKLERRGLSDTFYYALILGQLGGRERRLGELAAARVHLEQSAETVRRLLGEQNQEFGYANLGLSAILREWGDLAGAERAGRTAHDVMAARMGAGHFRIAEADNHLALVYRAMDRPDSALACVQRSLAIYRALGDTTSAEMQNPRGVLAALLGDAGRYTEAAAIAGSAAANAERELGPDHNYVPSLLLVEATALRAAGRLDEAAAVFDSVLVRRVRRYGHVHPDVEETLAERAWLRVLAGDPAGGWEDLLLSAATLRRHRTILLRSLDEASAMALLLRPRWTSLDLGLSLAGARTAAPATITRLHDEIVRQRGLLLEELLLRRRAVADSADDSGRLATDGLRAALARAVLSGDRRADALLDSLAQVERQAATVRGARPDEAAVRDTRGGGPGTAALRAALPPAGMLVSLVRHDAIDLSPGAPAWKPRRTPAYDALLLRADGAASEFVPLGRAARIDSLLDAWHRAVSGPRYSRAEERRRGAALRRALLDPVLAHASGIRDVYWVPDGALTALEPGSLPADDGRYLVEQPRLWHRLTTEADLLREGDGSPGAGLLAVGGADYESAAPNAATSAAVAGSVRFTVRGWDCESVGRGEFPPLPASRAEALAVADHWRAATAGGGGLVELLLGSAASERAVRQRIAGRRGVHLATHGFRLEDRCDTWSPAADSVHRMLFRSGLAVAGVNHWSARTDPSDDGLLTAGEVSSLPLAGTEWVCLSSCQSGLGDAVRGEGAMGLVRAFRLAGARRVLMSRWVVADEDAARWNDEYYRGWLEQGLRVDEAARRASLRLLAERRRRGLPAPPPTWACFGVEGEPD